MTDDIITSKCFFCNGENNVQLTPIVWETRAGREQNIIKPVCEKCLQIEEIVKDKKFYRGYVRRNKEYAELDGWIDFCGSCLKPQPLFIVVKTSNIPYCIYCSPHRAVMSVEKEKLLRKNIGTKRSASKK